MFMMVDGSASQLPSAWITRFFWFVAHFSLPYGWWAKSCSTWWRSNHVSRLNTSRWFKLDFINIYQSLSCILLRAKHILYKLCDHVSFSMCIHTLYICVEFISKHKDSRITTKRFIKRSIFDFFSLFYQTCPGELGNLALVFVTFRWQSHRQGAWSEVGCPKTERDGGVVGRYDRGGSVPTNSLNPSWWGQSCLFLFFLWLGLLRRMLQVWLKNYIQKPSKYAVMTEIIL